MIIKSSQRAGAKALADHLTKHRDDDGIKQQVTFSGGQHLLAKDDVHSALSDFELMAWASPKTQKHLYHVSINPDHFLTQEQWAVAWKTYMQEFGLENHPYLEVTHEKKGRVHQHRVFERVDTEGKAIKLSFTRMRNEKIARILEHTFQHDLTIGKHNRAVMHRLLQEGRTDVALWMQQGRAHEVKRPQAALDYQENQQQRRTNISKQEVKQALLTAWATTANGQEFQRTIITHNLILAKGDRRDFVIVDKHNGTHSPRRLLGQKMKVLRNRWSDLSMTELPTVAQVRQQRQPQQTTLDTTDLDTVTQHLYQAKAETEQAIIDLEAKLAAQQKAERETDQRQLIEALLHWQRVGLERSKPQDTARQHKKSWGINDTTWEAMQPYDTRPTAKEKTPSTSKHSSTDKGDQPPSGDDSRQKRIKQAFKTLKSTDYPGYRGQATREYRKELARKIQAHGIVVMEGKFPIETDKDIAIRLYGAGFSRQQTITAIADASPQLAGQTEQIKAVYIDRHITPALKHNKVRQGQREMWTWRRERGLGYERRLDRLGLATEVPSPTHRQKPPDLGRGHGL